MNHPSPNKPETPDFIARQYAFAAHIRDPLTHPAPDGVEDRRMAIYRELFYNNIAGFIESGFPVLHAVMDETHWHAMVRDFFVQHRCETPIFTEIAREFLEYLQTERGEVAGDPGFLRELAHYEWVELALSIDQNDIEQLSYRHDGDLLDQHPLISPLAWPLSYQYDVHHISTDYQPEQAPEQATHVVVYRNRDDEVRFMTVTPVTQRLLYLLIENDTMTGREALSQIARELQHPDPSQVIDHGLLTLRELQQRDIVLGTN